MQTRLLTGKCFFEKTVMGIEGQPAKTFFHLYIPYYVPTVIMPLSNFNGLRINLELWTFHTASSNSCLNRNAYIYNSRCPKALTIIFTEYILRSSCNFCNGASPNTSLPYLAAEASI